MQTLSRNNGHVIIVLMIKREAEFQSKFNRWLINRWQGGSSCFELKCARTDSLNFAEVKEHQIRALKQAKDGVLVYKIGDDVLGQKPFDCFTLVKSGAYVVVQYYKPRMNHFYMIDIDDFIKESQTSTRRSLLESRALAIGQKLAFE